MNEPEVLELAIPHMTTKDAIERIRKEPDVIMQEAFAHNMELGAYLNRAVPYDGVGNPQLDAFNRVLEAEGLVTKTDTTEGVYAAPLKKWLGANDDGTYNKEKSYRRVCFHEYTRRHMEGTMNQGLKHLQPVLPKEMEVADELDLQIKKDSGFTSLDVAAGTFLRPYTRGEDQYEERPQLVIDLSDITRGIISISGAEMKMLRFKNEQGRFPTFRFTEYANIPVITAETEEITSQILKHGVGIEMSYEWIRRNGNIGIDQFALWMAQIAIYWQLDEVSDGLKTLMSVFTRTGNPAPKSPIAWGSPGEAGDLEGLGSSKQTSSKYQIDIESWLNFRKYMTGEDDEDSPPKIYTLTNIFARSKMITKVEMLPIGSTNIRLQELYYDGAAGSIQRNPSQVTADGVRYGWTGKGGFKQEDLLAIDRNWAMNYVVELGSDISEMDKFIRNQTHLWTISKNYGFDLFDEDAIVLVRNDYASGAIDFSGYTT